MNDLQEKYNELMKENGKLLKAHKDREEEKNRTEEFNRQLQREHQLLYDYNSEIKKRYEVENNYNNQYHEIARLRKELAEYKNEVERLEMWKKEYTKYSSMYYSLDYKYDELTKEVETLKTAETLEKAGLVKENKQLTEVIKQLLYDSRAGLQRCCEAAGYSTSKTLKEIVDNFYSEMEAVIETKGKSIL